MVKIGVNISLWSNKFDIDSVLNAVWKAKNLGFEFVELPLERELALDIISEELHRNNIECVGCLMLPSDADITSENYRVRERGIQFLRNCVNKLKNLDGNLLTGVIYAPWNKVKSENAEDDWRRSVEALRQVCRYARSHGILLGVEPINRYRTYLLNTSRDAVKFVKDVGESNLKVHLDTYHMNIEEDDFYKPILEAGELLCHLHCSENNRGILGTGHIEWDDVFRALTDIGYDGYIGLESYTPSVMSISWKRGFPDPDTLAIKSLEFLKKMLKKYLKK